MMVGILILLKGMLIGLAMAAPVGPIGVLCIRRTLAYGRLSGLISGLGAATADLLYGIVVVFGLTTVSDCLVGTQMWMRLLGSIFLFYLAIRTFIATPQESVIKASHISLIGDYFSTFFLNLTNPLTILAFFVIFAGFGIGEAQGSLLLAILLVLGIFLGAVSWWLVLSEGISRFHHKMNRKAFIWVNRIAGITIGAFACYALYGVKEFLI